MAFPGVCLDSHTIDYFRARGKRGVSGKSANRYREKAETCVRFFLTGRLPGIFDDSVTEGKTDEVGGRVEAEFRQQPGTVGINRLRAQV